MMQIGKFNRLKVLRKLEFGYYLDGQELGEILIPLRYAPADLKVGSQIEVFIYFDSEDRIIATTEQPIAKVGEFAYLNVVTVNDIGAFLYWGLPKDLLVPFREQKVKMVEGKSYLVFIYIDAMTDRIAASAKIDQFLNHDPINYLPGDEVDLIIAGISEIGYKAIINNRHLGILYKNEVFTDLVIGQETKGYIYKIRPDNKIDLRLFREGYEKVDDYVRLLLDKLESEDGFLPLTDKSSAEEINFELGISKKSFKQAVGALYKKHLLELLPEGIRLLENPENQ
ncbi:MAG: GntR family transcriptional regulator [Bacteroidales bacterium]|nr:GntR family transcriptional regulator [Bacteroidales bacterium]